MAGIGVADSVVLSILAFVLGSYYVRMLPKNYLNSKGNLFERMYNTSTSTATRITTAAKATGTNSKSNTPS